jgi:pilus assembly protein Flp/PilA
MAGPPFLCVPSMIDNVEVEDRQRLVLVNRRTRDPFCTVAEGRNREGLQSRLAEGCRRPVSAFDLIASRFSLVVSPRCKLSGRTLGQAQTATYGPREPKMKTLVSRFVNDETGAADVVYGLIAAGMFVAIIAVMNSIYLSVVHR